MSAERKKILEMLAAGRITADEADRLLAALEGATAPKAEAAGTADGAPSVTPKGSGKKPKYLCVKVHAKPGSAHHGRHDNVDIRVPLMLLKAGVKLGSLVPDHTKSKFASHLQDHGIGFDVNNLDAEKLEALIEALTETSIDVDDGEESVRICCE